GVECPWQRDFPVYPVLCSGIPVSRVQFPRTILTLYEALTENESYKTVPGPTDISGRYLSEDLPCGMTSLLDLSEMMHVPAPHIEALVTVLYMYLGKKYEPFLTPADLRVLKALK
ncbi:NAD/NADP octopine/nopaline dehydrogenase family protein, partial [uncultured Dialister sp.]|uniref:NAD/NADP octopine/nopaline dehydrogenase family protein n=1 Tax=uncultured Dialister sp. TaxID=278064 RepID=UPI0025F32013